jgi:acetyl esterase/lipase
MSRIWMVVSLLALTWVVPLAQQSADPRDLGGSGAMSREELSREPIEFHLDIPYAESNSLRHRLDVYLPKERKLEVLPVIAFFHGGGWMHGDKADAARRLLPFVRSGHYIGVSIGYRLSGDAQWPAQLHDSKAAIRWIRANAARFGVDADRIGVWGRDAGAHLALMLGVTGDVPALDGNVGDYQSVSSSVSGVANFFGVSDLLAISGQPSDINRALPGAPEARLIGGTPSEHPDDARAASPVTYVSANDPPVLTVHGDVDRTVPYDQAARIDAALRRVGVPSYLITVKGGGHGDFGTAADDRVKAYFDRYLRGQNVVITTAAIIKKLR